MDRRNFWLILLTVVAVLNNSGCEKDEKPTDVSPSLVYIKNTALHPDTLTVTAGTTVTWENRDEIVHHLVSGETNIPDGLFEIGPFFKGGTFSFTFDQPGIYGYFCLIHAQVKGAIIVQ